MPVFLRKIELFGFKSFADRTKIEFNSPITALVGPNGSGKSNVIDAIRWVLGESSSKVLRGNTLEDIIFSGSQHRYPLGVAEVSLLFDNTRRILSLPIDEVEIIKRCYRSGESKIMINKQEVRVKDVVNLFLGTGFSREGYSIVGQGEVDKIVVGTSQERRTYIDELLGLTKVKFKKKEAEKRLQDINSYLSALALKLETLERDYLRLENETKKLSLYRELSKKLEYLEKLHFLLKVKKLKREITALLHQKESISRNIDSLNTELSSLSLELSSLDVTLQKESLELSKKREELRSIEETIKSKEIEKRTLEAKIDMSRKTIEIYRSSVYKENQRKTELQKEKTTLQGIIDNLSSEIDKLNSNLNELKQFTSNLEKEKQNLEKERLTLFSKIDLLREAMVRVESLSKELEWITSRKKSIAKDKENLSLSVDELKRIVEANEKNRSLLLNEIKRLKEHRSEVLSRVNETVSELRKLENTVSEIQSVVNSLSEESEKLFLEFSENLSESALVVGELITIVDITFQKIVNICDAILSQSFELPEVKDRIFEIKELSLSIYNDIKGVPVFANATEVISKKVKLDEEIMSLRSRLEETRNEILLKKEQLSALKEEQRELEVTISSKEQELSRHEKIVSDLLREVAKGNDRLQNLEDEFIRLDSEIQKINLGVFGIMKEVSLGGQECEVSIGDLKDEDLRIKLSEVRNSLERMIREISLEDVEEKIKEVEILISQKRNELLQVETKYAVLQSDLKSSIERVARVEDEIKKVEEFVNSKQSEVEVEEEKIKNYLSMLEVILSDIDRLSEERKGILEEVSKNSLKVEEISKRYKEVLSKKDEVTKKIASLEREFFSVEEKIAVLLNSIESIEEQIEEKYGIRTSEVENTFSFNELEMEEGKVSSSLSQVRDRIREIGYVNEKAEEEFKKVREEYISLKSNIDDILQSKQKLEEMIRNINEEIKRTVSISLDKISEVVNVVFGEVFDGGGVKIELDGDDLIEGGIEISVSIPGKKVKNLSLLSGGEKALVGIIFIFSALMMTNTPVVIMDEVDAPLDDENIERFKRLILAFQDKTQFILVSHNKSTIEICHDIYGVTMEEKGVSKVISYRLKEVLFS